VILIGLVDQAVDTVSGTEEDDIVDHDKHAEDKLDDLDLSDVLLPPDGAAKGCNCVVIVHGSVDEHVCPSTDVAVGTVINIEQPGKRKSDNVVINMEEAQTVLAEHKEDSVDKLPHFADEETEENPVIEALEKSIVAVADHLVEGGIGGVTEDAKGHSNGTEQ